MEVGGGETRLQCRVHDVGSTVRLSQDDGDDPICLADAAECPERDLFNYGAVNTGCGVGYENVLNHRRLNDRPC